VPFEDEFITCREGKHFRLKKKPVSALRTSGGKPGIIIAIGLMT
jgi:hypothetical protein